MRKLEAVSRAMLCGLASLAFLACGRTAAAQALITSTSASTLARSGRLLIQGSGFGAEKGVSRVDIGGLSAPVTRWSDTLIAAYVPEAAATGASTVQVVTPPFASNAVPLTVTLRQPAGRVRWRFQADAPYISQRPAVGPDGTIIVHDAGGFVYALTPDGGLKWVYKTRVFAASFPSVGADGTAYVADSTTVTAIAPDGTVKWTFSHPTGRAIAAGPTVGPDGKIYLFVDVDYFYALNPDGTVAWQFFSPDMFDLFEWGAELVFGPSVPGQPADRVYLSFGVNPNGFLWSLKMATGEVAFAHHQSSTWDVYMQPQGQAATAPDGVIYTGASVATGSSSSINAFSPDGALKWSVERFGGVSAPEVGPTGDIYFAYQGIHLGALSPAGATLWNVTDGVNRILYPIVNPAGGMVFAGGGQDGQSGFVRAYSSVDGSRLWQIDLPAENGGTQLLGARPRFAADGRTVYFGTNIPTAAADSYCYLYAVDTTFPTAPAKLKSVTLTPSSVVGGSAAAGVVTLVAPAPAGGQVVTLACTNAAATAPSSVTVPAGALSATFAVSTMPVAASVSGKISATSAGVTRWSGLFTVKPPTLRSLAFTPSTVVSGASSTGKLTLSGPAPAGFTVTLTSANPAVAPVPASVTFAPGASTTTFGVTAGRVTASTAVYVTAKDPALVTRTGRLTVKP